MRLRAKLFMKVISWWNLESVASGMAWNEKTQQDNGKRVLSILTQKLNYSFLY